MALNPDTGSRLPYLVSVPVDGGPLLLKTREPWPRTSRVYCHRASAWPEEAEIVDEADVRVCERRGRAIDLVLDRGRENRSQLVFVTLKDGREAIFWQTPRTTRANRPGVRLPSRRASGWDVLDIVVDTRERYPYRFAGQQAVTTRRKLDVGDYAVEVDGVVVAAVERKRLEDLAGRLVDGQLGFLVGELAELPRAAVVVEARYSDVFRLEHVAPGFVADLVARLQVRYPSVPIVWCGTRKLAEEWTFRFLGAAKAEELGERRYGDPVADREA